MLTGTICPFRRGWYRDIPPDTRYKFFLKRIETIADNIQINTQFYGTGHQSWKTVLIAMSRTPSIRAPFKVTGIEKHPRNGISYIGKPVDSRE